MALPRILFLTCMSLEQAPSGSMYFMDILLRKHPKSFCWFSLSSTSLHLTNHTFRIPYAFARRLQRPTRIQWLRQFLNMGLWARMMGNRAARFGREQQVEVVLADMAFEAVVAGRVAAQILKVPLLVSVHDDPVNRIAVKGYPNWLVNWYERQFAATLQFATRCGVISDYMGEYYQSEYGTATTTLYIGVDPNVCLSPKRLEANQKPVIIGSIGSMNSNSNWELLIESIRMLNDRNGEERYRILHIGRLPRGLKIVNEVEVTGWLSENEFLLHLKRIDIGFLNWSFAHDYRLTGRTSFPLKIHSYIQAQRPMLALGPVESSVCRFVKENGCGEICTVANASKLAQKIERLVRPQRYEDCSTQVEYLKSSLSRDSFFSSFQSFIDVNSVEKALN